MFPDWIVTVGFYVALHAVDALLQHDNVRGIVSHETRNDTLKQVNRYRFIYIAYRPLYDLSRRVRYLANPTDWVPSALIEKQVLAKNLYPIEQSVTRLTGLNLNSAAVRLREATP
jgi:uncharacterized membrane protein YecN with MAPEG domain